MKSNSTRRRDRGDIIVDILDFLRLKGDQSQPITRIIQACNLKYAQVSEFLSDLVKSGFVERVRINGDAYRITKTGSEWLEKYVRLMAEVFESRRPRGLFWHERSGKLQDPV